MTNRELEDEIARLCVEVRASPDDIVRVIFAVTDVLVSSKADNKLEGLTNDQMMNVYVAFLDISQHQNENASEV
jgi:hypothetical protein